MKGYSVKLPLKYDKTEGPYVMNKKLVDVIKQNLKMLILTNPGEKIMDPSYGVGIKKLMFHMRGESNSEINIYNLISNQVKNNLPYVVIDNIDIMDDIPEELNYLSIMIEYSVPSLSEKNSLLIQLK